ncbi:MAG: acyl-CoA thioesterase [Planctomycetes bacterium]|nr:acyl-CoA thioesterase [Planctomycetota bacterium]
MLFRKRYRYRFGDIDRAGIAYYPGLLHAFHCAMEDWWAEGLGTSYHHVMQVENFGMPAVRLEADFYAPIRYGDEPWIHLGVLRVGRSSVELGFWMSLGEGDSAPACRARITTAGVDMRDLSSVPIPERWRAAFAAWSLPETGFPGPPARGA